MVFKQLLKQLVESVPGAEGAVFADWEGETVDLYMNGGDDDHARFFGAHHGILLDAVRRVAQSADLGETQIILIQSEKTDYITAAVHDGYYIVLAIMPGLPIARARLALDRAVRDLRIEMGY